MEEKMTKAELEAYAEELEELVSVIKNSLEHWEVILAQPYHQRAAEQVRGEIQAVLDHIEEEV